MSQREFAKSIGLSARQISRLTKAGIVPQRPDGSYDQQEACTALLRNYRDRLTISEGLCRRFMPPGELEGWYEAKGVAY